MKRMNLLAIFVMLVFVLTACIGCNNNNNGDHNDPVPAEEIIGGDWRVQRGYTEDFILSDCLTVCFSGLSDNTGYGVYDASNGDRIGSLVVDSESDVDSFQIKDHNGDGINDIGLSVKGGAVLWYGYDPEAIGTWSENNVTGGFYLIEE